MSERIIVIGSGPGGYKSAVIGAKRGFNVTLIEKNTIGGVCTNTGCIPSKALLSAAESVDNIKGANRKGIDATLNGIDFKKVMKNKERAVKISRKGVEKELSESGVNIIQGEAKLNKNKEVEVNGETLEAEHIIIATGSQPIVLPFLEIDEENILTNKGALTLDKIPESMLVIGGGYVGVEMAFFYSSMGTTVTVVELLDRLLPVMDQSLGEEAEGMLKRKGVKVMTGAKVSSVNGKKSFKATIEGNKDEELEFEKILCSVGRKPSPPETDLDIIAEDGGVITDDFMRTPVEGVYAVGDVTGKGMLAHTAYHHAKIVVDFINGQETKGFSDHLVPACVFTHPEIASVGLSEEDAGAAYENVTVASYPVSALGRGYSTGERTGRAKLVCADDEVIGMHLVCPGATDMIMEGTIAIQKGLKPEDIIDTIHPHPTYSEAIKKAAELLSEKK